jgi:riboflavin kinase/FMN adenylyltransferase
LSERPLEGVAYVGDRPIVGDGQELLEVHIFDFDADCYSRLLHVTLVEKIRDDLSFDSFDKLQAQISVDAAEAKRILKNNDTARERTSSNGL